MAQTYHDYLAQTKQPLYTSKQVKLHGRTKKAILETIRICKDRNILKEYLESREKEVVDIMMVLYDEEEAMRTYVESERDDAQNNLRIEMALDMLRDGEPIEKIIRYCKLSKEKILELQHS